MTKINKKQRREKCQNTVTARISGGGASSLSSPTANEGVNTICHPEHKRRISKAFTLAEVFSRHSDGQRRVAFTLAEVLITLGIIGVVAAMTMPALMAKYQRSVVETRLAKFYSTINQAIKMSEVDNGDKKDWAPMKVLSLTLNGIQDMSAENAISAEEWYNRYLKNYIKTAKAEASNTAEEKFNLYFTDGSMVTFSGSSWIFYPDAKNYMELENEDSGLVDRDRDGSGRTNFTFRFLPYASSPNYHNKGVEPYLGNDNVKYTDEKLKTDSTVGCYTNASIEHAYCTELIRRNGWKIPNDYPWLK